LGASYQLIATNDESLFHFLANVFEDKLNDGCIGIDTDLPGGKHHLGAAFFAPPWR
jgi:hypothetical protein